MQIAPCDRSGIYELIEIRIIKFGLRINNLWILQAAQKRKRGKRGFTQMGWIWAAAARSGRGIADGPAQLRSRAGEEATSKAY